MGSGTGSGTSTGSGMGSGTGSGTVSGMDFHDELLRYLEEHPYFNFISNEMLILPITELNLGLLLTILLEHEKKGIKNGKV
jgi:hypothetical protein